MAGMFSSTKYNRLASSRVAAQNSAHVMDIRTSSPAISSHSLTKTGEWTRNASNSPLAADARDSTLELLATVSGKTVICGYSFPTLSTSLWIAALIPGRLDRSRARICGSA